MIKSISKTLLVLVLIYFSLVFWIAYSETIGVQFSSSEAYRLRNMPSYVEWKRMADINSKVSQIKDRRRTTILQGYVEWELLVKFKKDKLDVVSQFSKINEIDVLHNNLQKKIVDDNNMVLVKLNDWMTVDSAISSLLRDQSVESVQPNFIYSSLTNDVYFDNLWALKNNGQTVNSVSWMSGADISWIKAREIADAKQNNSSWVIVAIIDTGVDYYQKDLQWSFWDWKECKDENGGALWWCINGYDFIDNDKDPYPASSSHWTHIAWIISANSNNSLWVAWVASNVKIMVIRAWDWSFDTFTLAKAIRFAQQNWAKIINASWGWAGANCENAYDEVLYTAMKNFPWLIVAAAWNSAKEHNWVDYFSTPSDYWVTTKCWEGLDNVISVAATDQSDNISEFSDYSSAFVHIGAPWVNILSTIIGTRSNVLNLQFDSLIDWSVPLWYTKWWDQTFWAWNFGSNGVLYWDWEHYFPYLSNINALIEFPPVDLSWKFNVKLQFVTQCDTEYNESLGDYMNLVLRAGGKEKDLFRWNEYTLDKLKWETNDANGVSKYYYIENIPEEFVKNDLQIVFWWHTNATQNNYDGCFVDDVVVTYWDESEQYDYMDGTSMAVPYVVWAWALLANYWNDISNQDIKSAILNYGDNIFEWKLISWMRLNVFKAISSLADPSVSDLKLYTSDSKSIEIPNWSYINGNNIYVTWNVPINQGDISWYEVQVNDTLIKTENNHYSFNLTNEWDYSISVNWVNSVGKMWSLPQNYKIWVDRTPPTKVNAMLPWSWAIVNTKNIGFSFSWGEDIWSWIGRYVLYIFDDKLSELKKNIILNNNNLLVDVDLPDWKYNWTIKAFDRALNESSYSNLFPLTIDTIAPSHLFDILINNWRPINASNQNDVALNWKWNVIDAWIRGTYQIIDMNNKGISWEFVLDEAWLFAMTWVNLTELADWNLTLKVQLVDLAWNKSDEAVLAFSKMWQVAIWSVVINGWVYLTNNPVLSVELTSSVYPINYAITWDVSEIGVMTWAHKNLNLIVNWDWIKIVNLVFSDAYMNVSNNYVASVLVDTIPPSWDIQQLESWLNFNWNLIDPLTGIETWWILWYWSLDWWETFENLDKWTMWIQLPKRYSFSSSVVLKVALNDLAWNNSIILSPTYDRPWFDYDNSLGFKFDLWTWASLVNDILVDDWTINVKVSGQAIIKLNVLWATSAQPVILEVNNPYTGLKDIAAVISSDSWAYVSVSKDTEFVVKSVSATLATQIEWDYYWAIIPDNSVVTTNSELIMKWYSAEVRFSTGVSIDKGYNWIIMPPTILDLPFYSALSVNRPLVAISLGANGQSMSFSGGSVNVKMDLGKQCFQDSEVMYWNSNAWESYNDQIKNKSCNWNLLSFDTNHFSIYWWNPWITPYCSIEQVNCSVSCWLWIYTKSTRANCAWGVEGQSCVAKPCVFALSAPWWWGWWWFEPEIKHVSVANVVKKNDIFPYKDIDGHWSKSYVESLYGMWVFDKKDNFFPDANLKRAEIVKVAIEINGKWIGEDVQNVSFVDVPSDAWYIKYLSSALKSKIVSWDDNWNTFRPWDIINRAEAIKIFVNAAWIDVSTVKEWSYSDVATSAWYFKYINFAALNGIIDWYGNWIYEPTTPITRAQMSVIATRINEYKNKMKLVRK